MSKRLPHIFTWLIATLVFFIPSNLFLVLNESLGYSNGLRVDYLLPKLHVTDLLIIPIIVIGLLEKQDLILRTLKKSRVLLVLGSLLFLIQFFAAKPIISFIAAVKGLEMGLLFIVLLLNKKILHEKLITIAAATTIIVQFIFGVYQFVFQKSLSPYLLLGESYLTSSLIGLARASFGGQERLLAYGTTAHPNILAGTVVLLYLWILKYTKDLYFKFLLLPVGILLFLTQSWSATIALIIGLVFLYKPKIVSVNIARTILWISLVIPFVIPFIDLDSAYTSISRRVGLLDIALNMVESHPLIGVGLNNFTAVMEEYGTNQEFVRFIQPVHNSFWLYIAETGVVGIIFFWRLSKKYLKYFSLRPLALALIPLLSLDHYLTTNQTGVIILLLFLAVSTKKKTTHPRQE